LKVLESTSGNVVSVFVYASKAHVPDYMVRGGVAYRIVSDHLGSVRMVVDAATGAVVQRVGYDEFGVGKDPSDPRESLSRGHAVLKVCDGACRHPRALAAAGEWC
jgi:hypothetical protein